MDIGSSTRGRSWVSIGAISRRRRSPAVRGTGRSRLYVASTHLGSIALTILTSVRAVQWTPGRRESVLSIKARACPTTPFPPLPSPGPDRFAACPPALQTTRVSTLSTSLPTRRTSSARAQDQATSSCTTSARPRPTCRRCPSPPFHQAAKPSRLTSISTQKVSLPLAGRTS